MMKKLLALGLSLGLILSLAGCGVTGEQLPALVLESSSSQQSGAETSAVESGGESSQVSQEETELQVVPHTEFEDTIDGLCEFLTANKAVAGDPTEMAYETIGAVEGYRYRFTFGSGTVQVEVYAYDLENLSEEATKVLDSVKETGTFQMLDKEVSAVLSDNGRYLMIYTDAGKSEQNTQQKERVEELFKGFYA